MRKLFSIVGVLIVLFALYSMYLVPTHTQYVVQAEETLMDIKEMNHAVHAVMQNASISTKKAQTDVELFAINHLYTTYYPLFVNEGRLFYQMEAQRGGNVCLIDENVKFQLFKNVNAVGQEVTIGETVYKVVGVVKKGTSIGTNMERRVYIPYQGAKGQFKTIVVSDKYFEEDLAGTKIDLKKERMRASIIGRLLMCFVSFSLIVFFKKKMDGYFKNARTCLSAQLKDAYFKQIFIKYFFWFLLILLGYAVLLGAFALTLQELLAPLYLFPEWVPEVLVERTNIEEVMKRNIALMSETVVLKTQEIIRFEHFRTVMNIGCLMILFSIGRVTKKCLRKKD